MKRKHLWVLKPCLLAMLVPAAWAEDQKAGNEEQLVVSASRSHRSAAEMAQTTWIIESQEIEQQVQGGKEIGRHVGAADPRHGRQRPGPHQLWHEYARPFDDGDDRRRTPEFIAQRQPPIDSIDPFNIDHIEVISGATSLYGGGSTGGLINIVTKKAAGTAGRITDRR